jgi:ATP adenylyltransferase
MPEQRLWASWRLAHMQAERAGEDCIFCPAGEAGDEDARPVLHRGVSCFATLKRVRAHLDPDELLELMAITQRALRTVRDEYRPDGFNLGVNEGEIAAAGFADHVHLDVVPRCEADNNVMAVAADARVLSQSLPDINAALRRRFDTATGGAP